MAILSQIYHLSTYFREIAGRGGKPVVGWFCSYTPQELLTAAGLYPYRLVPEPSSTITAADVYLGSSFCPYVRSCLAEALDGRYQFLGGLIVVNSCDAMRRLYDAWRHYIGSNFVFLLDLPRVNSELSVEYYRECLVKLAGELEARYQVKLSADRIDSAVTAYNRMRSLLREIFYQNREKGMPLSAVELQKIVRASTVLPVETFNELGGQLVDMVGKCKVNLPKGPRLLISGSIMDNPDALIEMAEQCGAKVVCDDFCTGTRLFWQFVEPDNDSMTTLSRYYLNRTPCPRMHDAQKRFEHISRLIKDFHVDGVILYTLKFCDPFLFDIPVLRSRLKEWGIPSLSLECDYTPGTLGQMRTRIQAFVEMLGGYARAA
jgi:bzd-type benzoyl-CoA reductase N subunit